MNVTSGKAPLRSHQLENQCSNTISINTWKSLRVLDTVVNSILGRSGGMTGVVLDSRLDEICRRYCSQDNSRGAALQSAYDICPFMDELDRKQCTENAAASERFLQRLQTWSKALPPEMRSSAEMESPMWQKDDRQIFLGGTHIACMYYFAVILTYVLTLRGLCLKDANSLHVGRGAS